MTKAEQAKAALKLGTMDFSELLNEAEETADAYDQDWDNGITWFEYVDGSVAAFHSQTFEIMTYGSRD